ncbi:MAG: DUF3368 domain-containing protein [Nitrospira sp. LK70]|nr:DUF3368 domain-containing protein [Nitrospira sp. LK70]
MLQELEEGRSIGIDLLDVKALPWLMVCSPTVTAMMPFKHDLGPGETEVLLLPSEMGGVVALLDDGLAREEADRRRILVTGTLGLLLNAKRARLMASVKKPINQLQLKRFRLSPMTRATVLKLAGEEDN